MLKVTLLVRDQLHLTLLLQHMLSQARLDCQTPVGHTILPWLLALLRAFLAEWKQPAQALRLRCRDQPHLALLLQHALSQARPGADTGARLARAVSRLLGLAKQRAALPQHAWNMKLSPAPVSPQYLRSLRGPGRSICTPRCARSSHVPSLADLNRSSCTYALSWSAIFAQPTQP